MTPQEILTLEANLKNERERREEAERLVREYRYDLEHANRTIERQSHTIVVLREKLGRIQREAMGIRNA